MHYNRIHLVRIFKPNHGGMELIVNEIARVQKKNGLSVAIVTSDYIRASIDKSYVEDLDVYRLKHLRLKGIPFSSRLRKMKLSCDKLHIHGMDPFVDVTRYLIKYQDLIISPHGGFFHTSSNRLLKNAYLKVVSKFIYRNVTSHCISYNDMELSRRFTDSVKYMGCGFKKRVIDFSREKNEVLILGRISPNKRVDVSIEISNKYLPDSVINVIGHDEIGLMKKYNGENVIYHGALDDSDTKRIARNCRYFVIMSSYEGLGMTLIEALYSGFLCLISDIPSFRLIAGQLNQDLISKFIVFVDEVPSNITLPAHPSEDDVFEMRRNIDEVFSWESVVKNIEEM